MKKTLFKPMLVALVMLFVASVASVNAQDDYASKMKLRYTTQSGKTPYEGAWMEYSLPIGNGQLGATFMGGVATEYLQFNEKTLWTGASDDYSINGSEDGGSTVDYGAYQNFGVLTMTNKGTTSTPSYYVRELNLMDATGKVEYTTGGVTYTREFIASYPDQVVAVRLSAGKSGQLSYTFSLSEGEGLSNVSISYANGGISLSGSLESVNYASHIKIVNNGGTLTVNSNDITVSGANEILILLAAGTSFTSTSTGWSSNGTAANVLSTMQSRTAAAASKGWTQLYADHVKDYQNYFGRVKFDLNGSNTYDSSTTTQNLVDNYDKGTSANDLLLEQLYFAYGRYLEISSSRGVALPSNLQGIWNHVAADASIWNCDIHFNINAQMNYWPAEATGLGDMHMPFLNYIMNMSKSGPWKLYGKDEINNSKSKNGTPVTGATADGTEWTTFTENNIYGGVGYFSHDNHEVNAWLCTHLWQHFEYSMDYDFLEDALPTMISASKFWFNRLYKDSDDGSWVVPDSYSPEQGSHGVVAAYTQQIVYELFSNTTEAIAALEAKGKSLPSECTTGFREMLGQCLQNIDKGLGTETVSSTTLLKEWKNVAQTSSNLTHRHLSHLMCMYPFNQVSEYNTDYFTAAKNSLSKRGDAATGWAMGWKINLWARALDGDHAHTILENALKHSERKILFWSQPCYEKDENSGGVYYNLWSSHAPFQIDGNFGATAGITEMLFQSHSDVLNILPALPSEWKGGGTITGLKGRGNFTVGITWSSDVNTANVTINNNKGQVCNVKCGGIDLSTKYVAVNGNPVDPATITPVSGKSGVYTIPSKEGDVITIDVTRASEYVAPTFETVATPVINPAGGEVQEGAAVTITCATEGASIYYTIDGTTPTTSSTKYTGAITVNSAMTINAIAAKEGNYTNSEVATANFTIKEREVVATPVFSPAGGEFYEPVSVEISCATSGATVYYTTNGSTPTAASTKYTGAITVSSTTTIKAIAVKDGYYANSNVAEATYTILEKDVVATPVISPAGGEVEEGATVTISCATDGAAIYYTLNGEEPTTASTKYTGAIAVNSAMTVKAIAVKDGNYTNSAVATANFTIKPREVVATPVFGIAGGEVEKGTKVTVSCATEGATIYFTTDGTEPTKDSNVYNADGIVIGADVTVKAIAMKDGYYVESEVAVAEFITYVMMTRTISVTAARKFGTCIIPFDYTLPDGVSAYSCDEVTENYIVCSPVKKVEAGVPYILYTAKGVECELSGKVYADAADEVTVGLLTGFALNSHNVTLGDNCYVLQDKGDGAMFYNAGGVSLTMPYNRCYLTLPQSNGVNTYRLYMGATGIECVDDEMEGETVIYDIYGRRVTEMLSGHIYIVNGKKIYIK